jgi:MFS superfamily sulfate permease-like transporter
MPQRNDVIGGLVSAAVAIPLAMGYGMFAFAALGENYFAHGAIAGLATAFIVAIVCVVLGDRTTTVYAPRVTTTFFLGLLVYGLAHSDTPAITAGGTPLILAITFSVVLLAGAFEALFGLVRLGTLIKFAPQPVMAGFQNAAAALLFLVQLGNVCGFDRTVAFTQLRHHVTEAKPLSVALAAITFVAMWNARRWLPKIPPLLVGIGVGSALYYLGLAIGLSDRLGPVVSSGPSTHVGLTAFPYFADLARAGDLATLVPTILGAALALAMIAAIDALLCTKLVSYPGAARTNGDQLLVRLGLGNVAAACIGGIVSGINIGPSIVNRSVGGRSWLSVVVNAAALMIAAGLLFRWLGLIPRSVLSATIMVVAVQHFDVWSLRLAGSLLRPDTLGRFDTALDLAVVVVVAVLSVTLNIVLAVFAGIAIAVGMFVLRMSRSIVRRSYRCGAVHSRTSRPPDARHYLETAGDAVLVVELQGALFFGTGERTLAFVESAIGTGPAAQNVVCVILDLRRLTEIDSTGAGCLVELQSELSSRNVALLLAIAERSPVMQRLTAFGVSDTIDAGAILPDVDRAIERAEDQLLNARPQRRGGMIALTDVALFSGFAPDQFAAIERHMRRCRFPAAAKIFREGDPGDEVYVIVKGSASAYLSASHSDIRLATFATGTLFGELALLDSGSRSATVVADEELVCYALSTADFHTLAAQSPAVAIKLLAAIGRELSGRLRGANRTIQQLEA